MQAASQQVAVVAQHYNKRSRSTYEQRVKSPIYHLRCFNNWIKTVLISETIPKPGCRVLDLCGGKGGDLKKWSHAQAKEVVLVDIAEESVKEAERAYQAGHFHFQFKAHCRDAFLEQHLQDLGEFDIISCQFAFHYAFETEERATQTIKQLYKMLRPGGVFILTCPDADKIIHQSNPHNSLYGIQFEVDQYKLMGEGAQFGQPYLFSLMDAVDQCKEYLVFSTDLFRLAKESGFTPRFCDGFMSFYDHYRIKYSDLLQKMNVWDETRKLLLSPEEMEVASLYSVYCFEKKKKADYHKK